jgi:glycosyltransferase involved in cell wall biosynthesis
MQSVRISNREPQMGTIASEQIGQAVSKVERRPLLSIVTPAFNEAQNLPVLYERLCETMGSVDADWEWVVVDDHSRDATFSVIADLAQRDPRVRGTRLARNFGAHMALTCGLHESSGDCVVALAGDLQDPPELIPQLLDQWRQGVQVAWAARARREGETVAKIAFSRIYHWLMRNMVGMKEMSATGADFFLLDRKVVEAFSQFREANVSILALIAWMGFRQATIGYDKQARLHGQSGWDLKKKLKLLVDSIASFSYVPIRFMSYVGFAVSFSGFVYSGVVIFTALRGSPVQGWASLMVVVLVVGGIQMLMMGVLGEYLWRALDESRRRPKFIIEATTGDAAALKEHARPSSNAAHHNFPPSIELEDGMSGPKALDP